MIIFKKINWKIEKNDHKIYKRNESQKTFCLKWILFTRPMKHLFELVDTINDKILNIQSIQCETIQYENRMLKS